MMTRQAVWSAAKIAKGLCGNCGRRKIHGKRACKPCKAKNSQRALARYYARKRAEMVG